MSNEDLAAAMRAPHAIDATKSPQRGAAKKLGSLIIIG